MPTLNNTTKTTDKPTDGKEHRSDNKRLAPFFLPQAQHRKNGAKRQNVELNRFDNR